MSLSHYSKMVNEGSFADTTFTLNGEKGKTTIRGHNAIISLRCGNLTKKGVKKVKKLKTGQSVEIKDGVISPETLLILLGWVYTGKVDLDKLDQIQILKLNGAARLYEINRLQWHCESYLSGGLTMQNVFSLLKGANDLSDANIKGFCLNFAQDNYNAFITDSDGPRVLGLELFQEVVASANGGQKVDVKLMKEPADTVKSDYKELYDTMNLSDVTLNVDGTAIHCHSAILAAYSRELANLMTETQRSKKDFPVGQISASAFHAVLRYIYYGDKKVDPLDATQIIAFSKKYGLPSLQELCESKIHTSIETNTVIEILRVAYLGQMKGETEDLKSNGLKFIAQNLGAVDLSPLKEEAMPKKLPLDILFACQKEAKSGGGGGGSVIKNSAPNTPVSKKAKKEKKGKKDSAINLPPPILDTPNDLGAPPSLSTPPISKKN